MSLVSHFSDRLMVMYAGQVAEFGPTRQVFDRPLHPYTIGLMDAFPSIRGPAGAADRHPRQPAEPGHAARRAAGSPRAARRSWTACQPAARRSCTRWTARWSAACCTRTARVTDQMSDQDGRPDGQRHGARPLLRTDGPDQALPDRQRAVPAARCTPSTTSASPSASGRSSRWPGRAAAARARSPGCWPRSTSRPAARSTSRASRCRRSGPARTCCATAGEVPMVFQDPFASINPVFRVSHGVLRGLKLHRPELSADERHAEARAGVRGGRADPGRRGAAAVPARAERRPAAAGRLRPGAGAAAEADPGRRAGLDARRVDPDRPAQPDGAAARRAGRVDPVHHARHRQRPVRGRPADRHVRRPGRRGRARRGGAGQPAAPLHPAAAVGGARPARPARRRRRDRPRRAAAGDRPDAGLPVPLALPAGHRRVPPGHAGTQPARARPRCRLPCRRRPARK